MTIAFSLSCMLLSTLVMIMASNLAKAHYSDKEKNSPFECGFNPHQKSRIPFSLQFFLIALIFIIFDVEIILIIPSPLYSTNTLWVSFSIISLIIIILLGLLHEWKEGSLMWA